MHELIEKRYSPRAFDRDREVEPEKLREIFEAGRWAASSYNEQPWRFIFATRNEPDLFERLFDCLAEPNRQWVGFAPVIILTLAKTHFSRNGKPNRHCWHDVGLAAGNMSLQATALGLYLHQMAGFSPEKVLEKLDIPDGFEPVSMIALGYLGNPEILPDNWRESENAPRSRKDFEETVFRGDFGQPSGL